MSLFVSQLFNGLQTGSVYALVALGYSMVYGIILLLNFAHGDIIMVGAYPAFYAMTAFHLHPILSVVLAVVTSTLLGVVIEKVAYTPLRSAPRLSLLITAIGDSVNRMIPPLILAKEHVDQAIEIMRDAINEAAAKYEVDQKTA